LLRFRQRHIWKRCRTILVSNAGKNTPEIGSPTGRWVGQLFRTLNLVQQQAENSRKQILFGISNMGQRRVAFWSIDTPSSAYGLADVLSFSPEEAARAANLRTRLNPFASHLFDIVERRK
jgi:NTE family protein